VFTLWIRSSENWTALVLKIVHLGVRVPADAVKFSLPHGVQNGSGAHPASYPTGTRGSFPGGKAAGAWSWPHPPSAEVNNTWSYMSSILFVFIACCLVRKEANLILLLFTVYWTDGLRNQDSSASIVTRLRDGRPRFNSRRRQWWEYFFSPPRPVRLLVPPSLLSNGYRGKVAGAWSIYCRG
jgi:hypothetical protein